jgi:hypothetical protein
MLSLFEKISSPYSDKSCEDPSLNASEASISLKSKVQPTL